MLGRDLPTPGWQLRNETGVVLGEGIRGSDRQTEKKISWRKDYWKTLKLCLLRQKGIREASKTIDQLSVDKNFFFITIIT
jgi:hypothetical protein